MTPALKAMVEAMAAEMDQQALQPEGGFVRDPDGQRGFYLQGVFDLEKVARAGLEAIRTPSDDVREAGCLAAYRRKSSQEDPRNDDVRHFEALIDAILKDQP